jgi:hypothetical protein
VIVRAQAAAKAMNLKKSTITPGIVALDAIKKWSGRLPLYMGGSAPLPSLGLPANEVAAQKSMPEPTGQALTGGLATGQ